MQTSGNSTYQLLEVADVTIHQPADTSTITEINSSQHPVYSVLFTEGGQQVVSGGIDGNVRRWRVDRHEVREPIRTGGEQIYAAALSQDRKWLVCGLQPLNLGDGKAYVRVWNMETQVKVLDIEGHTNTVFSVDISPDSAQILTGSADKQAFIWSMTTGKCLVGPLEHEGYVVAVRFSPSGDRIATATGENPDAKSIRIYKSEGGQLLLDIPFLIKNYATSKLAWSSDGCHLFAASFSEARCFDTASGALLRKWSVPGGGSSAPIVLSRNSKFLAVAAFKSVSFWDVSTQKQIGIVIKRTSAVRSIALSPDDASIATGEDNGRITLQSLRDLIPISYFTVDLPFVSISEEAFRSWVQGDLNSVEQLLAQDITRPFSDFHLSRALAQRAVLRSRSKQWKMAIEDAQKSIQVQRSAIGHIALAIARIGDGDHEVAIRAFDIAFCDTLPSENKLLLLIKAIILFECGMHDDAILRVGDLINIVDDQSLYISVRAQMHLLLGNASMTEGNNKRAIKLFKRAQEAIPIQESPAQVVISLLFGWDFGRLATAIQLQLYRAMYAAGHTEVVESLSATVETLGEEALTSQGITDWNPDLVQKCLTMLETHADAAVRSRDFKRGILQYSTALSLNPLNPADLLVKQSNARAVLGSWEEALKDADQAIKADPLSPWGHEKRHAALHGLQRYDEAMDAFSRMLSFFEGSRDPDIRQLAKKYVSPSQSETAIDEAARAVIKIAPLVLIDIQSGRLCDGRERLYLFKSESQYKELISSMTQDLDEKRIQRVVEKYFEYVTLSHMWQGREPSFQDVDLARSVWNLQVDAFPLHEKLRNFCEVVRADGYRWAWSDTCCIDKTISTVLNQSLKMMYKWYEASTSTFVHLWSVDTPSAIGDLTKSLWMTRAWTAQELLAPKVIRFYDRNWKPYLGDTRPNHKESLEIMQELADAIKISRETIISFHPDDLTVGEKLRLASTRNATVEEDVAYSLIGVFKSDIRPEYGEGYAALGHLLQEIVARSGDVTVLSWIGGCSLYNSSLPASLSVYTKPPLAVTLVKDAEMDMHVSALQRSLSRTDAILLHDRIARLPPARFADRRLHLPCIIFTVRRLGVQNFGSDEENHYHARVSGIGSVAFRTRDRLPLTEPRKFVFVHPWIRDLRDPLDGVTWDSTGDDSDDDEQLDDDASEYMSAPESEADGAPSSPLHAVPTAPMDEYTRALRLIVRLQQPFHALLLQQQPTGEFTRVAADYEIVVPGIDRSINLARDIRTDVVEIL